MAGRHPGDDGCAAARIADGCGASHMGRSRCRKAQEDDSGTGMAALRRCPAAPYVHAMTLKTTFFVQTFELKRKRLVPGQREIAPTESGALKKAEAMAGRLPGTAALKIVADDETGELESAAILGAFGQVPDDFAEQLQGG